MELIPFIDWNGNGTIELDDIALSLAVNEELESKKQEEEEEEQPEK